MEILFLLLFCMVDNISSHVILSPLNAARYNIAVAELAIYENIDDSTFNKLSTLSFPRDKHKIPVYNFKLSVYGVQEITIISSYGSWLPLEFFDKLCSAIINQSQYPWLVGRHVGRLTTIAPDSSYLVKQKISVSRDSIPLREAYIMNLKTKMSEVFSYLIDDYTYYVNFPNPDLDHSFGPVPKSITRQEIIKRRRLFIEEFLSEVETYLKKNGIREEEYDSVFGPDLLAKFKIKPIIKLMVP